MSSTQTITAAKLRAGHVLDDGSTVTRVDVVTVGGSKWIEYATTDIPFSLHITARTKVTVRESR